MKILRIALPAFLVLLGIGEIVIVALDVKLPPVVTILLGIFYLAVGVWMLLLIKRKNAKK